MRQIFFCGTLLLTLALLSGCTLSKTKADTAEDMTGKAAYQKISAEDAYEMMVSQEVVVVDVRHPGGIRWRSYGKRRPCAQ